MSGVGGTALLSLQMRLAEAVDYPIARRPWTLCLALLLCATSFLQAQAFTPAEKDEITDPAGFSSSKTTRIADEDATTAVAEPSITSDAKSPGLTVERSDPSQSSNNSFFQDVVRHPPKTTKDKFHWGPALIQATSMTLFAHAWRAA